MSNEFTCDDCEHAKEAIGEEIAYGTHYCKVKKEYVQCYVNCNDWKEVQIKMKEFIIDETYHQVVIDHSSIGISGLSEKDVNSIMKDANSANMTCQRNMIPGESRNCITINVEHNHIVLKDNQLAIVLNPEEYEIEDIVINIK